MKFPALVFSTLIVLTLFLSLFLISDYLNYTQAREEKSIELGAQAGTRVAEELDAILSAVIEHANGYAAKIPDFTTEQALQDSIRSESHSLPILLGVTVAFEPGRFAGRERFAPFFNKDRDEFQFVEQTYDYTDDDLATAQWYTRVVAAQTAGWSDPYFAEAAQAMVVDYGAPIFDQQGQVMGMVDYTISLSGFTQVVDSLSVGQAGYGFTFEPGGAILSHPDPVNLMQNVFQLRDGKTEAILEQLRRDPVGVVSYESTYTFKYSWFFFHELESTGWKSVLVFAEDDLLGASDQGRRKIIHIAMGTSALILTVFAFLLRIDRFDRTALWRMVIATSVVIVGNIVVIWYLNLTTDFSLLAHEEERIVNRTILQKYVQDFDEELHKLTQTDYQKVPTGIFIESYELSSFEASLIGKLWMKYPKALYEHAPPAFYFPDTSAIEARGLFSEKISEVEHENHFLITWKFRVTLEQDFSYQQFPFEQNDVRVMILYPDLSRNVLLVPDLDSYFVLNPSVKPGLNTSISVPSSETISSFFTLKNVDYRTTFGDSTLTNRHPALVFTMVIKRIWLSPFIANIIPILIIALILFIVLYVSSSQQDERTGMTTMNVIQSSAGFLFILLLAHVNERNRIETPEIAYIELFYFSMYVLITLQSIALAMLFRGSRVALLQYHDNLIPKLAFWPVLLCTWLFVTLLRFY